MPILNIFLIYPMRSGKRAVVVVGTNVIAYLTIGGGRIRSRYSRVSAQS